MALALKIESTKIVETQPGFVVEMILSDSADLEHASNVVQLRAKLDIDQQYPLLAELQEGALTYAREAISVEIQRLRSAANRIRRPYLLIPGFSPR
jgi:hypothetical protein